MNSFNRVYILGNLSRDPRVHFTHRGALVCEFPVAVTTRRMEEGEAIDGADFLPVVAWDTLGRVSHDHLVKGSLVHVEGHLKTQRWVDKATRQPHTRLVVTASQINFLARLREGPPPGRTDPDPHGRPTRAGMGHISRE